MRNVECLSSYIHMQQGILFNELLPVFSGEGTITFSNLDEATYWNFALVTKVLSEEEIAALEEKFIKRKRTPAIYFENTQDFNVLKESLTRKNYKVSYEDSWMFYERSSVDLPQQYKVRKVSNRGDLELFLDIFAQCYKRDDPQNPYGELGEGYLKMHRDAWDKYHESDRIEFFIFFDQKDPVAVSTLTNYKDVGYISNVGSIPRVRGQGFGKLATLHCVQRSKEKGHNYHLLATEEGHFPHEFYQRLGFKTKFTAINYAKEEKITS